MNSSISDTARLLTTLCDFNQVLEAGEKLIQAENVNEEFLAKASLVNRMICLGFTITEIGMAMTGKKHETLTTLKGIELVPRLANMWISFLSEGIQIDGRLDHHSEGLMNYLNDHLNDPVPAADKKIIDQHK